MENRILQNFYECPCGTSWQDLWSCACNDRCPTCNREIEPSNSKTVRQYVIEPQRDLFRNEPGDETHFVRCDDAEAEIFAVVDLILGEICFDGDSRAAAEKWISEEIADP